MKQGKGGYRRKEGRGGWQESVPFPSLYLEIDSNNNPIQTNKGEGK